MSFVKDEEGKKRRQKRRQERKAAAIKERKKRFNQGKRNEGSESDFSYRSVLSAGYFTTIFVFGVTGRAQLIRSHSSAKFSFEISGNTN